MHKPASRCRTSRRSSSPSSCSAGAYYSSSISPLTSCERPMPPTVIVPVAGNLSLPLSLALRQGLADGLLDLALRAHPQRFEKFANAAVEGVFVHDRLLLRTGDR